MMFAIHFIPDSLQGWMAVAASFAVVAGTIISSIMFAMRKMLETLEAKIDGIRLNQQENTDATLRAVERVRELEVTINNGLTHRAEETHQDVEAIKGAQAEIKSQISEMHGWMQATHKYDGTDRRTT